RPPSHIGAAFAYIVLTCDAIALGQHRLHVRADGRGHRSLRTHVRPAGFLRTYSGQNLGKASGPAHRLPSRTVTVLVHPAMTANAKVLTPWHPACASPATAHPTGPDRSTGSGCRCRPRHPPC